MLEVIEVQDVAIQGVPIVEGDPIPEYLAWTFTDMNEDEVCYDT